MEARLKTLGTGGRSLVSDRAKAFIQLAEHGLECLSIADFFPVMHALGKSYALAIARRVRQAHQELKNAEEGLSKQRGADGRRQEASEAQHRVAARRAAVQRWEQVHSTYRDHLEALSLTLHPVSSHDSTPQTSAEVLRRLHAAIDAVETFAQDQQLPARHDAMKKVRNPLPGLAALGDFWWEGVEQE